MILHILQEEVEGLVQNPVTDSPIALRSLAGCGYTGSPVPDPLVMRVWLVPGRASRSCSSVVVRRKGRMVVIPVACKVTSDWRIVVDCECF